MIANNLESLATSSQFALILHFSDESPVVALTADYTLAPKYYINALLYNVMYYDVMYYDVMYYDVIYYDVM